MDYLLLLITFLSTSYSLIYSTEQLYERFYYYPHFTAVETESQKDKSFKVTQLVGGRAEITNPDSLGSRILVLKHCTTTVYSALNTASFSSYLNHLIKGPTFPFKSKILFS